MVKSWTARFALMISCVLMTAGIAAPAAAVQCAPYAREVSGIAIRGNADTWWSQAAGRYERGHAPKPGAVLAFAATHRMRVGHVAMVSRVVSDREVLLTHANWSRRGQIEFDVRAVDVSPAGDWSMVRVWYGPQGGLGTTAYPTRGFIYADHPRDRGIDPTSAPAEAPIVIAESGAGTADATLGLTGPVASFR